MIKSALNTNTVKQILTSMATATAMGAGMAGVGALVDWGRVKSRTLNVPKYFDAMLTKNPDIKEMYEKSPEDAEKITDLFKVLEDYAPSLVNNPLAAGTFLRQLAKYGDLAGSPDQIQVLTSINKNIVDTKKNNFDWGNTLTSKLFDVSATNNVSTSATFGPDKVPVFTAKSDYNVGT